MSAREGQDAAASPVLSRHQLAEVAEFGAEQPMTAGQLLFEAGEASYDLFVVLEGEVEIVAVSARTRTAPSTTRSSSSGRATSSASSTC
jgi:CRP-like cAMP-binding protein